MNKYKKIASLVVASVMAGTMVASLAACGGDDDAGGPSGGPQAVLTPKVDDNGKLTYTQGIQVPVALGYNGIDVGISYSATNISTHLGSNNLMGVSHTEGELKPAWAAFEDDLGISIKDYYRGAKQGDNIANVIANRDVGGLSGVALMTGSVSTINDSGANGDLLDISKYLDYMPNYKAFLEKSDIIHASLIANAQGSMYMLPYFDGNDDIEKFVLLRKDITSWLLDATDLDTNSSKFGTFKSQANAKNNATTNGVTTVVGTESSVTAFMGGTAADNYSIDVTNPALYTYSGTFNDAIRNESATGEETVKVYICYDKALASAKSGAIHDILIGVDGVEETDISALTSGNIVDIQNLAIDKSQGEVTGDQLLKILNAYIDVAYCTTENGGTPFYDSSNHGLYRSDVFNSASAAWDVDLYVALGRCYVTSGTYLGDEVKGEGLLYLISARDYVSNRANDVVSLAGELYGVRGLESRYNYTYIDENGDIQDARTNEATYEAAARINDLAKEGLHNTANNIAAGHTAIASTANTGIQTLSLHDYVQTQTVDGFSNPTWNFAPILTPVSKWDDGTGEQYMRFTESWRGVKDGGIAVSYANVKNSPERLSAVLAFIDYMYSADGQLLLTYGPQDTTNNSASPDGTWYATASTQYTLSQVAVETVPETNYCGAQYAVKEEYAQKCFIYKGAVYEGDLYIKRNIPKLTTENYNLFKGKSGASFTNHARRLLGTTLPIGNKDQGFEYQCTAECGKVGSRIFNIALANGTIKHQYQTLDGTDGEGNYVGGGSEAQPNYWYTLAPSLLPYDRLTTNALNSSTGNLQAISGGGSSGYNLYINDSGSGTTNILIEITYRGYDTSYTLSCIENIGITDKSMPANAAGCVALNNTLGMEMLMEYKEEAWQIILDWYAEKTAQPTEPIE